MTTSKSLRIRDVAAALIIVPAMLCAVTSGGAASAADDAGAAAPERRARASKDRGDARFTTGAATWTASRATVRQKAGSLRITASRMERAGDTMKRDQLNLNIRDFTGPGRYKADAMSMFVRVGIDLPKESTDQADAQKTVIDALGDARTIRLANAEIVITAVGGGYIDGTFSIEKPAGTPESTISDGRFHARIRE